MGDVAVLHVELHAEVGGQGLALVVFEVGDLDVEFLVGGGVEEELTALDLVLAHLNGVGRKPRFHARQIVAGNFLGDVVEPELEGGIVVGGGNSLLLGDGIVEGDVHIRAEAQTVLFIQRGIGQVARDGVDSDGQLAEAVDRVGGLVLDEQVDLVAALKGTHVEVVAVARGVGVALLLGGLEDGGLPLHGKCVDGGVGCLAVGADAPAQLEILKAEAYPAVELDHARGLFDRNRPVGSFVDGSGVVGAQDLMLDLVQAGLAYLFIGISPVDVAAISRDVGLGRLGLGLGLDGVSRLLRR